LNKAGKKTVEQWETAVRRMKAKGAPGDVFDEDAEMIINYPQNP